MGYTMSFPCKDSVSCEEMLSFLIRNFKQPDKLLPEKGVVYLGENIISWVSESDLAYGDTPNSIGFNINGDFSEPFSNYVYSVLAWAAGRAGKTLSLDGDAYKFMEYDGLEKWLFMASDSNTDSSFAADFDQSITGQVYINTNGVSPLETYSGLSIWLFKRPTAAMQDKIERLIVNELDRLTQLWTHEGQ